MTKNETELLEDWLKFHGYLFGLENIHVLDGSDDSYIFQIYEKYKPLGLNVHFSSAGLNDLGEELTQLMHEYKGSGNFLIKLDTDEFLAYTRPVLLSPRGFLESVFQKKYLHVHTRAKSLGKRLIGAFIDWRHANRHDNKEIRVDNINQFFAELPVTGQRYKASLMAWSIPAHAAEAEANVCRTLTQFTPLQFTHIKTFFHSDSFVSVDLGSHEGVSTRNDGVIDTGLTLIHYYYISVEDYLRRARQALLSHEYIDKDDSLVEQRHKLEKVRLEGKVNSFHKLDLYLKYLNSLERGESVDSVIFNMRNMIFRQSGASVEITLVRDTLNKIELHGIS